MQLILYHSSTSDVNAGASSAIVKTSEWKKQFVCEHISSSIILDGNVKKLSVIRRGSSPKILEEVWSPADFGPQSIGKEH
jgi:hypothetical protein